MVSTVYFIYVLDSLKSADISTWSCRSTTASVFFIRKAVLQVVYCFLTIVGYDYLSEKFSQNRFLCPPQHTLVDLEIQKYSTKGKRTKDNRQPEQQISFSEDTSISVCELHGVFIKAELSPRIFRRSYKYLNIYTHTHRYINKNSKQFSSINLKSKTADGTNNWIIKRRSKQTSNSLLDRTVPMLYFKDWYAHAAPTSKLTGRHEAVLHGSHLKFTWSCSPQSLPQRVQSLIPIWDHLCLPPLELRITISILPLKYAVYIFITKI